MQRPSRPASKRMDTGASPDIKDHYGVIIIGCGYSGLAANIQISRKLGFKDVMVYEKSNDIGGTWSANTYPGAGSDVPVSLYSLAFATSTDFKSQWAGQKEIMRYLHGVQRQFDIRNICFETLVVDTTWSDETGLWTLNIKNTRTGELAVKTCNVFISAAGALTEPQIPNFPGRELFKGPVFHSARWDHSVELEGKNVVLIGNGCSAAQIMPEIKDKCKSLTQIARSRQSILRRIPVPDGPVLWFLLRYIPGLHFLLRAAIFFITESFFKISDIKKGAKLRKDTLTDNLKYIKEVAPEKYWEALRPDFDIGAKRRVFDSGYYASLHNENVDLIQDDGVSSMTADGVVTGKGVSVKADVVVLCTGFKVQDFLFPLKVYNGKGESLLNRLKTTGVRAFQGTCVSDFPNFFLLMGPNTATGHSSVVFTSECQITMILKLIKPILAKLDKPLTTPAPSVVVTAAAEDAYDHKLRAEMKKKVWEKDGGVSWYVDQATGLCTTLYPWSQVHFWWNTRSPPEASFKRISC